MSGKQIKLFLVDGMRCGLTTAEMTTAWAGHVLAASRLDLGELLKPPEAQRTGVYLLLSDDAAMGDTRCCIGEMDVVAERLKHHQRDKDPLGPRRRHHLHGHQPHQVARPLPGVADDRTRHPDEAGDAGERHSPARSGAAKGRLLRHGQFPIPASNRFPVLRVNAIRVRLARPATATTVELTESPVFHLQNSKKWVDAQAQQIDGEFTMLAGSTSSPRGTASARQRAP